jgi:hypothetical protein
LPFSDFGILCLKSVLAPSSPKLHGAWSISPLSISQSDLQIPEWVRPSRLARRIAHLKHKPGLYLPWNAPLYLYYPTSVWRYTVYWALTLTAVTFGLPGSLAFVVFSRKGTRYATLAIWLPFFFVIGGCLAAFIYATVVGEFV